MNSPSWQHQTGLSPMSTPSFLRTWRSYLKLKPTRRSDCRMRDSSRSRLSELFLSAPESLESAQLWHTPLKRLSNGFPLFQELLSVSIANTCISHRVLQRGFQNHTP